MKWRFFRNNSEENKLHPSIKQYQINPKGFFQKLFLNLSFIKNLRYMELDLSRLPYSNHHKAMFRTKIFFKTAWLPFILPFQGQRIFI